MTIRKLVLFFILLLTLPAAAAPSLWHVRGPRGEAYILGSIHILPPQVKWRSRAIESAIGKSDVFVFEVPLDAQASGQVQEITRSKGFLAPGENLRDMLHPEHRADFDAALAASGADPRLVLQERPWLAGLQLMLGQAGKLNFGTAGGVDILLMQEAAHGRKKVRFLETIDQQFALLIPADPALELEEFESGLKDLRDISGQIEPLVKAWITGDQAGLDKEINGELDEFPAARKALLDDRNARWLPQVEAMLKQKHTFFITVGAGHLTGPGGIPALLRKDGYAVEGP